MKKITLIFITACVALSLSGCAGADYKKATELMENGNYEEAIEIFEELGNYKDSEDMITDCKYGSAVSLYDRGDYKEAFDQFKLMGDYKDSKEYAENAMWEILYDHYPKDASASDAIIETVSAGDYTFVLGIYTTKEKDGLMFQVVSLPNTSSEQNVNSTVAVIVSQGQKEATAIGMSTYSFTPGDESNIVGAATFDISTYKDGDEFNWSIERDFSSSEYESLLLSIDDAAKTAYTASANLLMMCIDKEFDENGLGFTLADIGFTSY